MYSFEKYLEYRHGIVPGEFGYQKSSDPNDKFGIKVDNPIRDFIVGNNPTVNASDLKKLINSLNGRLPRNLRKKPLV
jgi:hypothetical protein